MKTINLRNIPSDFRESHDIHTALAWNAVKKILIENNREELFGHIHSIRLSEKYIIITTEKPIVNAEIKMYAENVLSRFHESMKAFGGQTRKGIKFY